MSSTEENYNKLITKQAGPEKWLGVEESKAVFGNTKLVLDGDNSKIIQEKRFKQMAQLQREVQIGMLLKDLHHEEKMQNRIKYLFKNEVIFFFNIGFLTLSSAGKSNKGGNLPACTSNNTLKLKSHMS